MPSGGVQPAGAQTDLPPSHSKLSEQDRADLAAIDAAVARIKKVTPSDPYLVTIPQDQDKAYRHTWASQQHQWLKNAPFRPDEGEGAQYQTFQFHEPGESLYALHANPVAMSRPPTADSAKSTRPNTPSQGPKKVLSLSAYKNKQAGGTPMQEKDKTGANAPVKTSKQPAVKGPAERLKAESAEMLASVEEPESSRPLASERRKEQITEPSKASAKRKREDEQEPVQPKVDGQHAQPAPKKTRTDESVSERSSKQKVPTAAPSDKARPKSPPRSSQAHANGLPPKLSPLRGSPFHLPERLGPLLPPNIEEGLKQRNSSDSGSSKDKASLGSHDPKRKQNDSSILEDAGAPARTTASKSADGSRTVPKSPKLKPAKGAESQATSHPGTKERSTEAAALDTTDKSAKPEGKRSLVVKLKYKRARRDDIRRILGLPPRPSKASAMPSPPTDEDTALSSSQKVTHQAVQSRDAARRTGKGVAQKLGPATAKQDVKRLTGEKRPRTESDDEVDEAAAKRTKVDRPTAALPTKKAAAEDKSEAAAKKKKAPDALELKKTPSTPQADLRSPALTNGHRSQMVTPSTRKDLLSTSAGREASSDSQVNTPSAKSNTPTANGHGQNSQSGGATRPPSSQPSNKTPQQQAWDTEFTRLNNLGRELKHSAQDDFKMETPERNQLAAVKLVECLLCFVLAFACSDESALSADPKRSPRHVAWKSLMGFYPFVQHKLKDFPLLAGLAASLATVFYKRIAVLTNPADEAEREAASAAAVALERAAIEADTKLDIEIIMEIFPRTWKGRTKGALPADSKLAPKKMLTGAYRLPIGVQSGSVPAVRAGMALLREYMDKEKIGYELRLSG